MSPNPRTAYTISTFPGLYTNTGPSASDSPVGAASIQENLQCTRMFGTRTRPGLAQVQFDDEPTSPPPPP